jgi:hypothetical protein
VAVLGEQRLRGGQVVVWRDEHLILDGVRDAAGVRHRRGKRLGRLRRLRHQRIVVAAVVTALELQDLVALAEGARRPQRKERGLRAGRGEPDLLATARPGTSSASAMAGSFTRK